MGFCGRRARVDPTDEGDGSFARKSHAHTESRASSESDGQIVDVPEPTLTFLCEFEDRRFEAEFRADVMRTKMRRGVLQMCILIALFSLAKAIYVIIRFNGRVSWTNPSYIAALYGLIAGALASFALYVHLRLPRLPGARVLWETGCVAFLCFFSLIVPFNLRYMRSSFVTNPLPTHTPGTPLLYATGIQFARQSMALCLSVTVAPLQFRHLCFIVAFNWAALVVAEAAWPMLGWATGNDYAEYALIGMCFAWARRTAIHTERHEYWFRRSVLTEVCKRREVERQKAEERMEAAISEERLQLAVARAAKDARSRLIRTSFHDLRSPMLSVNNVATTLQKMPAATPLGSKSVRKALETLDLCSMLMERISSDMLDFERIDSGRLLLVYSPFKIGALLESGRSLFDAIAAHKGVRLVVDVAPATADLCVSGDFGRLLQCLQNGISNAVKFTDAGKEVRLRAWRGGVDDGGAPGADEGSRGGAGVPADACAQGSAQSSAQGSAQGSVGGTGKPTVVHVAVEDEGCGLSPSELATLSEGTLFAQVGKGQLQGQGGTGLGLNIARQILQLHRGSELRLSSPGLDQGTNFEMVIRCDAVDPDALGKGNGGESLSGDLQCIRVPAWALETRRRASVGDPPVWLTRATEGPAGIDATPAGGDVRPAAGGVRGEADAAPEGVGGELRFPENFRCLHVEDDGFLRMTMAMRLFDDLGVRYDQAEDGEKALELVARRDYQVVVMDNQMPRLSGIQATRRLREQGFTGLIIGLTGDPVGSADRSEFEASGLSFCEDKGPGGVEHIARVIRSFAVPASPKTAAAAAELQPSASAARALGKLPEAAQPAVGPRHPRALPQIQSPASQHLGRELHPAPLSRPTQ